MVDCAALVCQPPVRVRFSEVRLKKKIVYKCSRSWKAHDFGGVTISICQYKAMAEIFVAEVQVGLC